MESTTKPLSDLMQSSLVSGKVTFTGVETWLGVPDHLTILNDSEVTINCSLSIEGSLFLLSSSKLVINGDVHLGGTVTLDPTSTLEIDGDIHAKAIVAESPNKSKSLFGRLEADAVVVGRIKMLEFKLSADGDIETDSIVCEYSSIESQGAVKVKGDYDLGCGSFVTCRDLVVGSTLSIGVDSKVTSGNLECQSVYSPSKGSMKIDGKTTVIDDFFMGEDGELTSICDFFVGGALKLDGGSNLTVGKENRGNEGVVGEVNRESVGEVDNGVERNKEEEEMIKRQIRELGESLRRKLDGPNGIGGKIEKKINGEVHAIVGSITPGVSHLWFRESLVVNGDLGVGGCLVVASDLVSFGTITTLDRSLTSIGGNLVSPEIVLEKDSFIEVDSDTFISNIPLGLANRLYDSTKNSLNKPKDIGCAIIMSSGTKLTANELDTNGAIIMEGTIRVKSMMARESIRVTGDQAEINVTGCLEIAWNNARHRRYLRLDNSKVIVGSLVTSGLGSEKDKIDDYERNGVIKRVT